MAWKNLALLYERGLGVEKDAQQAQKYFALAARENVPGAAEGLERLSGQPAAKRFPATSLRITGVFLLGLAAFLGIGLWDGVPSERLFSGVFTLFFIASSVFILCKVNQRQPQLPKPLRILYIVLGALLVLAGILGPAVPARQRGAHYGRGLLARGMCAPGRRCAAVPRHGQEK